MGGLRQLDDAKCMKRARARADLVRKNPRDALANVLDMRVGSYDATAIREEGGCKVTQMAGYPADMGTFESAELCLPQVLRSPACASGVFMHSRAQGVVGKCLCCSSSEQDGET